MEERRLVAVGKIVRTHGIRGAVKIYPYGESLSALEPGDELILGRVQTAGISELTVESLRPQGKFWVARFEELIDIDAGQEVVGEELFLPEDRLPATSEGEYYHYQLIGLTVETREGRILGTLRGIIQTGSNDVYAVEHGDREVLIPAVEEIICQIDLERGRMVIDPPEGLIDDL